MTQFDERPLNLKRIRNSDKLAKLSVGHWAGAAVGDWTSMNWDE